MNQAQELSPPLGALWPQGYEYLKGVNRRLAALEDFRSTLRKRMNNAETRLAEMQEMILGVEQRLGDLESGPRSQRITELPTKEVPSHVEPCPICGLLQYGGPHKHPMAPAPVPNPLPDAEPCPICGTCPHQKFLDLGHCPVCHDPAPVPDSPPERIAPATSSSPLSGQPITIYLAAPSCGCALSTLEWVRAATGKPLWGLVCSKHAVWFCTVEILAQDAVASEMDSASEST